MANGNSGAKGPRFPQVTILRTLRKVKPGQMAVFMNAITWQAAWLRHFHQWERMVVGYALTDIPERVLEVYGIPETDPDKVRAVLDELHAQEEFQELKAACEEPREQDDPEEELLPAMPFNTFLNGFFQILEDESAVVARRESAEEALAANRARIAAIPARRARLQAQISAAAQVARADVEQVAEVASAFDIEGARRELERLSREQVELEARQPQLQAEVNRRTEEVRNERDPRNRESKFGPFKIPEYFLNVAITVKPDSMDAFTEGMERLTRDFKWEFIAAGRHLPKADTLPKEAGTRVMHLWKFGDADNLYQQMVELRENQQFAQVEQFTSEVVQMLMCDWEALSETKKLPPFREQPRRNKPAPRPLPPGPEDLVILARDDEFYWLTKDSYQDGKHDAPAFLDSQAQLLAKQGVLLGDILLDSTSGADARCFLVNLSGIRPRPAVNPTRTRQDGRQSFQPEPIGPNDPCFERATPAMDDLIVLGRDGRAYWVKTCEYQRPECKLETADPILAEQVRLLTNQGVVLADVPGDGVPDTDEMGCLVNLLAFDQARIEAVRDEEEAEDLRAPRPLPPGPDDLVILARDDEFYWITKDSYQRRKVSTSMGGQVKLLTEQGVLLSDIPVGSIPGVGAMCFLVNLSSIRPRPEVNPTRTRQDGRQSFQPEPVEEEHPCVQDFAPAIDDLIIRGRDDEFYWIKTCEYQRPECMLKTIDPLLAEQVRLLTNRGVMLADVPGDSVPDIEEMGCLVNLHGLHRPHVKEELEVGTGQEEQEEAELPAATEEAQPFA